MLSFFRRILGNVLGTIIGYLPNLVVSPILLVISALSQPWFWLDFTWGVVGTALGLVAGMIIILLGGEVKPAWGKYAKVLAPNYLGSFGAFSLGSVLSGCYNFSNWKHEYGHTWQNRLLGPVYLFIIAIPSLISAGFFRSNHHNFFTEKWANAWSNWP